ncbi:hypothetical protein RJ639_038303, partial [Escallonia herrerae]
PVLKGLKVMKLGTSTAQGSTLTTGVVLTNVKALLRPSCLRTSSDGGVLYQISLPPSDL